METLLLQVSSVTDLGVCDIYFCLSLMQCSKQSEVKVQECISCGSEKVLTAVRSEALTQRQI